MKKIALAAALGLLGMATGVANAATTTGDFTVTVNLTPKCQIALSSSGTFGATATLAQIDLTYTSFQSGTTGMSGTSPFSVRCTKGVGYTVKTDLGSFKEPNSNITYTLGVGTTATYTGGASTGVTVATASSTAPVDYLVGAQIDLTASEPTCASSSATCGGNKAHTLTIEY